MNIQKELFDLQDLKYRDFQASLVPNVSKTSIIGVRTPNLRKLADKVYASIDKETFLSSLPHEYHEENLLHFFVISKNSDYEKCVEEVNRFLPYVTNWAVCDQSSPNVFKKHHDELLNQIMEWLQSDHLYTVRFAIRMLMNEFLGEKFSPKFLELVGAIKTDEYYLQMMQAWYFATALAKQYDATIQYLEKRKLDETVFKMTIRKARESFRVTDEHKSYLKHFLLK